MLMYKVINIHQRTSKDMDGALHTYFTRSETTWGIILKKCRIFTTIGEMNSHQI